MKNSIELNKKIYAKIIGLAISSFVIINPVSAIADYTVIVDKADNRGEWEGWGTSLSWWAKGIGKSPYENMHADVLFTTKNVEVMPGVVLPGLGLNIARYNPGGGGLPTDNIQGVVDKKPAIVDWYKDIDGFWINWFDFNPQSASWDWNRDENQRSMMEAAKVRGASFEFFFNAPMWWMTYEKSSAGGAIQPWNEKDYAYYIANVVNHAKKNWNIDVKSVEPFNEPSAGWWKFPNVGQEGLNLSLPQQVNVLKELRTQLNGLGLNSVQISAADENTMTEAIAGFRHFQNNGVSTLVDRMNVHAYYGLEPWRESRDNTARSTLKSLVGNKPIRISEYGDNDADGMTLVHTISEDINYLKPSSWVYWQVVEPYSSWGLINSDYYAAKSEFDPNRGSPYKINNKYYLFSQFTRYLRPKDVVIGANDKNTVVAYNSLNRQLKFITVNFANPQKITYDLRNFNINNRNISKATTTYSTASGSQKGAALTTSINNGLIEINAEGNAVYSVVVDNVDLMGNPSGFFQYLPNQVPLNTSIKLQASNFPDRMVRHVNFATRIDPVNISSNTLLQRDSSFVLRQGLGNTACYSFESVNFPGYFLQHQNFGLRLIRGVANAVSSNGSTFCARPALNGSATSVSLESLDWPGYYIRHTNFNLVIAPRENSGIYLQDASFNLLSNGR